MLCNSSWYLGTLVVCALGLGLSQPGMSLAQQALPGTGQGSAAPRAAPGSKTLENSLYAMGARLAAQGVPDKSIPACASCHGAFGEGASASGFPRLAGQSPAYLVRQIESFAQDTRTHPLMSPIAKAMTIEQSMASAAYYAALDPDPAAPAGGRASAAASGLVPTAGTASEGKAQERGQRLANIGDEALQIQACATCHGLGGKHEPPGYPYLNGQHASYLANALIQWKSGQRRSDLSAQMQVVASRLSDADIAAVAAYYASLPPPAHRWKTMNSPVNLPARNSLPGRGAPAVVPSPQGAGSEPSAPASGGTQGHGGAEGSGATGVNPGSEGLPPGKRR